MANPGSNLLKSGGRQASDTLSASVDDDDLALPLNSASEFDDNSMIVVVDEGTASEEEMEVSGKSGSSLTVVTRGVNGTTATGHDSGATVSAILSDFQWDQVIDAINEEHDDDGSHEKIVGLDTNVAVSQKDSGGTARAVMKVNASDVLEHGDANLTGEKIISPYLDFNSKGLRNWDGWLEDEDTWVYASATTFTIAGKDVTAKFPKGTKISYNDGSVDYGTVASAAFSTDTTITLIANDDYAIADETLTAPRYSYVENPQGFPHWFDSSSIAFLCATSGTITFSSGGERFCVNGRKMTIKANYAYSSGSSPVGRLQIDKSALAIPPANLFTGYIPIGYWSFSDTGDTNDSHGEAHVHNTSEVELQIGGINNSYLSSSDFGAGDIFFIHLDYEF